MYTVNSKLLSFIIFLPVHTWCSFIANQNHFFLV